MILVLAVSFANAPDQFPQAYAQAQKAQDRNPEDYRWWLLWRYIYLEDSLAQWVMCAFTVVAAYYLWRTFRVTQDMAIESTLIGRAQVRAYLDCVKATAAKTSDSVSLSVKIRNSGQSPARFIALAGQATVISDDMESVVLNCFERMGPISAEQSEREELRFLADFAEGDRDYFEVTQIIQRLHDVLFEVDIHFIDVFEVDCSASFTGYWLHDDHVSIRMHDPSSHEDD